MTESMLSRFGLSPVRWNEFGSAPPGLYAPQYKEVSHFRVLLDPVKRRIQNQYVGSLYDSLVDCTNTARALVTSVLGYK